MVVFMTRYLVVYVQETFEVNGKMLNILCLYEVGPRIPAQNKEWKLEVLITSQEDQRLKSLYLIVYLYYYLILKRKHTISFLLKKSTGFKFLTRNFIFYSKSNDAVLVVIQIGLETPLAFSLFLLVLDKSIQAHLEKSTCISKWILISVT